MFLIVELNSDERINNKNILTKIYKLLLRSFNSLENEREFF